MISLCVRRQPSAARRLNRAFFLRRRRRRQTGTMYIHKQAPPPHIAASPIACRLDRLIDRLIDRSRRRARVRGDWTAVGRQEVGSASPTTRESFRAMTCLHTCSTPPLTLLTDCLHTSHRPPPQQQQAAVTTTTRRARGVGRPCLLGRKEGSLRRSRRWVAPVTTNTKGSEQSCEVRIDHRALSNERTSRSINHHPLTQSSRIPPAPMQPRQEGPAQPTPAAAGVSGPPRPAPRASSCPRR